MTTIFYVTKFIKNLVYKVKKNHELDNITDKILDLINDKSYYNI